MVGTNLNPIYSFVSQLIMFYRYTYNLVNILTKLYPLLLSFATKNYLTYENSIEFRKLLKYKPELINFKRKILIYFKIFCKKDKDQNKNLKYIIFQDT